MTILGQDVTTGELMTDHFDDIDDDENEDNSYYDIYYYPAADYNSWEKFFKDRNPRSFVWLHLKRKDREK